MVIVSSLCIIAVSHEIDIDVPRPGAEGHQLVSMLERVRADRGAVLAAEETERDADEILTSSPRANIIGQYRVGYLGNAGEQSR